MMLVFWNQQPSLDLWHMEVRENESPVLVEVEDFDEGLGC